MAKHWQVTGLDELHAQIADLPRRIESLGVRFINTVAIHLAERAEYLAPVKTFALRASIMPTPVRKRGGVVESDIVATVDYAAVVYTAVQPAGLRKLGDLSRRQPTQPEGPVGGAFIERALEHNMPAYNEYLGGLAKAALSGDGTVAGVPFTP